MQTAVMQNALNGGAKPPYLKLGGAKPPYLKLVGAEAPLPSPVPTPMGVPLLTGLGRRGVIAPDSETAAEVVV